MNRNESIHALLDKVCHYDKDIRIIALSDLHTKLERGATLSNQEGIKVCSTILDRLDKDSSSDVQAGAVRCLSTLLKRATPDQTTNICGQLLTLLSNPKKHDLHDIYAIGLKSAIAEASADCAQRVVETVTPVAITGCSVPDPQHAVYWVEIVKDLAAKYGRMITKYSYQLASSVVRRLDDSDGRIRKRASTCLGELSIVSSEEDFKTICSSLLDRLDSAVCHGVAADADASSMRSYVQTIAAIARRSGRRLQPFVSRTVELLLRAIGEYQNELFQTTTWDDIRENCFIAIASLIQNCSERLQSQSAKVHDAVIMFMSYDPNVLGDDEQDDDMEEFEDMSDVDDYEFDQDDDDTSWKVRRAAAQTALAMIATSHGDVSQLAGELLPVLITRLKEREELVGLEIINCIRELCHQIQRIEGITSCYASPLMMRYFGKAFSSQAQVDGGSINLPHRTTVDEKTGSSVLSAHLEELLAQSRTVYSSKTFSSSTRFKEATLGMLSAAYSAVSTHGVSDFTVAHQVILLGLNDKQVSVSLAAIDLFNTLSDQFSPELMVPHISDFAEAIVRIASSAKYKASSCALQSMARIATSAKLTAPDTRGTIAANCMSVIESLLHQGDLDQDIKDSTLIALSGMVANLKKEVSQSSRAALPFVLDRLSNEASRLAALRALCVILSVLEEDLEIAVLDDLSTQVSNLLKQQAWQTRKQSLELMCVVADKFTQQLSESEIHELFSSLVPLIDAKDLTLSAIAVDALNSAVVNANDSHKHLIPDLSYQNVLGITASAADHQHLLQTVSDFFGSLNKYSDSVNLSSSRLLNDLFDVAQTKGARIKGVAIAAASVVRSATENEQLAAVKDLLRRSTDCSLETRERCIYLICLARIGSSIQYTSIHDDVIQTLQPIATSETGDVQSAAAEALGHFCASKPTRGIEKVLSITENKSAFLQALQSFLAASSHETEEIIRNELSSQTTSVLQKLQSFSEVEGQTLTSSIAACLCSLGAIVPSQVRDVLVEMLDRNSSSQTAALTALSQAVARSRQGIVDDDMLRRTCAMFTSSDARVTSLVISLVNAVAEYCPILLRRQLSMELPALPDASTPVSSTSQVLSWIYYHACQRSDLVRVVDLGPFKHKIDEGIPVRKAAFAALSSIALSLPDRLDQECVSLIINGLKDENEVKLSACSFLIRLMQQKTTQKFVHNALEQLCATYNILFKELAKESGQADVVRSAVRSVLVLSQYSEFCASHALVAKLVRDLERVEPFSSVVAALRTEQSVRTQ